MKIEEMIKELERRNTEADLRAARNTLINNMPKAKWTVILPLSLHPPSQETPHLCGEECYYHPLQREVVPHARRMTTP